MFIFIKYHVRYLSDEHFLFTDTHNSLQLDSLIKAMRVENWLSRQPASYASNGTVDQTSEPKQMPDGDPFVIPVSKANSLVRLVV